MLLCALPYFAWFGRLSTFHQNYVKMTYIYASLTQVHLNVQGNVCPIIMYLADIFVLFKLLAQSQKRV